MKIWYVYMIRCAKGALYTGMTDNVLRRVAVHNSNRGAKCLKALGLPVTLVYFEEYGSKGEALRRERFIKHLSKAKKEELVLNVNDLGT